MGTSMDGDAVAPLRHRTETDPSDRSERYREMLRATVDWLWSCDRALNLTAFDAPTQGGERALPDSPCGRALVALFSDDADAGAAALPTEVRARRAFRDLPGTLGETPILISGVPAFDGDGRFAGYHGSARAGSNADDAAWTLLREFEQLLMRSNEVEWRLGEASQQAKSTRHRIACLLHELRTPLNAVNGYAELAQTRLDNGGGQAVAQDIARLREASGHMAQMLQGFQRATIEGPGGDWPCHPAGDDTRLDQAMQEAMTMVELSARQAGVRLHALPPAAAETPTVRTDQRTVTQILINLLSNAVKFTPAGGEVGICIADGPGGRVRVAVWDTGPGIAPQEQERIFERSYRATPRATGRGANQNLPDGQGLGLSIARDLARSAGGDLAVESQPDHGATFFLELPAAPAEASACA